MEAYDIMFCMDCGEFADGEECKYCRGKNLTNVHTDITMGDYIEIKKVSNNPNFIKTMIELHQSDIIEYQIKLSQLKQADNSLRCPYCKSSNVLKISATSRIVSAGFFGLGSKKIGKQFHCNNCRADF